MGNIKNYLKKIYGKDMYDLQYGRECIIQMAKEYYQNTEDSLCILDIGLGQGIDIVNINNNLQGNHKLFGVESYGPYRLEAEEKGITVVDINIESDNLPFHSDFFDLIIINQVLEHTKELYFILSEIQRVLKNNGACIIGVPNMVSWHERIRVLFGKQPNCIRIAGPHVRGFTADGFIDFLELENCFKVVNFKGSYFYGMFYKKINIWLAAIFPKLCVSIFFTIVKDKNSQPFSNYLEKQMLETNYYRGNY